MKYEYSAMFDEITKFNDKINAQMRKRCVY